MKSLTIKSGILLTVIALSMSLVSCTPYSNVGVGAGYGAPYGGNYGYGYSPYRYGYGYGYRPPIVVRPAPRYYSAPRTYGPRSYGGGGRGYSGGGRGGYSGGRRR